MARGTFIFHRLGQPASSVYSIGAPGIAPGIEEIPSGCWNATQTADRILFLSDDGELWLVKDRGGPGPRLLMASSPASKLAALPTPALEIEQVRKRFRQGYGLFMRQRLIDDIATLLRAIDGRAQVEQIGKVLAFHLPT